MSMRPITVWTVQCDGAGYERVDITADDHGRLCINAHDAHGNGHGHRLTGPKYRPDKPYRVTARATLDAETVNALREYLALWDAINSEAP